MPLFFFFSEVKLYSLGKVISILNLAVIQVAKSSDDLLLIKLIRLQLHTPHGLHGAVVLQSLFAGHNYLSGWGFIQLMHITFLEERKYPL